MFALKDKVAIVTGAASGIGNAIARRFAAEGARVHITDLKEPEGRAAAESIVSAGGKAVFHQLDVADETACGRTVAAILEQSGGYCDILVNNAGIGCVGTILTTTAADIERLMRVNVLGVFHMSKAMLPGMIARGSGSIVNMASIGGVMALADRFAYCTTKFAVVGMTKCMAIDHAKTGVRINCICPARVATPWVQQRIREYPDPAKALEQMSASQPVGRMGEPEEIAALALYLASDESRFTTGSALTIDGGMSAGI